MTDQGQPVGREPRHCPPDPEEPGTIYECTLRCADGPCSRQCQVCRRLAWTCSPPCPACPDFKRGEGADRAAREGRCPDGGYCHGSALDAGSAVCATGHCYRVQISGPLSDVFPGDRWPDQILEANGIAKPDGRPLRDAIIKASDMKLALGEAMGSRDGWEAIAGHLDTAAELAREVVELIGKARANVPAEAAKIDSPPRT